MIGQYPQHAEDAPEAMHQVGEGEVVVDGEEDARVAVYAVPQVPLDLEVFGQGVAEREDQAGDQPIEGCPPLAGPHRRHRAGNEEAAGYHQQGDDAASQCRQAPRPRFEGLRIVGACHEVNGEQQQKLDKLAGDADPDAMVAGDAPPGLLPLMNWEGPDRSRRHVVSPDPCTLPLFQAAAKSQRHRALLFRSAQPLRPRRARVSAPLHSHSSRRAQKAATSSRRQEKAHSLSNHRSRLSRRSPLMRIWLPSTMTEWGLWLKSTEAWGPSEQARTPKRSAATVRRSRLATSAARVGRSRVTVRSMADTLGSGTRIALAVMRPSRAGRRRAMPRASPVSTGIIDCMAERVMRRSVW